MRIISGKYRGRKLFSPSGDKVRPTSDNVKESIFNIIQFDVAESRFLDLFSGSGSMGCEALSRGAQTVVFADKNKECIELVKKNLALLNCDNAKLIHADYKNTLSMLRGNEFDIVFLDPPYNENYLVSVLQLLDEFNLLAKGGRVLFEHLEQNPLPNLPDGFIIEKEKRYGSIGLAVIIRE